MSPNHQRLRNSHRAPLFLPLTTLILWTFLVPLLRDNGASVVAEWDRLSVKPTFDCHKFSNDPKACRAAYCHYRCCDRTCQSGKNASAAETCGMDPCSRHCFDVFSCRRENATYCEYDVVGGNCRKGDYYKNCRDDLFRMNECRELGKFYIDAGIPCKNFIESGNCKQIEVVRAVNINGEEVFDHVKSIRYRPDGPFLYVDDHGTRMSRETYENVTGTFPHLQSLYQTFLVGKDRLPEDSRCLKYWIPIEMAGSYQLTLHLQEPKFEEEGKRYFNVKFNGHGILMEVDLFKLIGAKNHAAEFVLQFEVESDDILWLKGYMPSIIHNKRVDLAFCQGSHAEHNTAYVGSAFSVLRFTGSQGSTLDADLKPNAKPIIPAEELCAAIGNNLCECKKSGCEYDVREKACKYGKTACPFLDLGWNICRKPGSFLAHGGLICPVEVQEGNCKIVKVIKAFNLNGIEHTDKEDVTYKPEDTNPSHFLDSGKTRVGRKIPPHGNCHGTPPIREIDFHDLSLYSSLVYGSSSKRDSGHCLTYLIPVEEDGRYLLTIKTVDSTQQHAGSRLFNVRFQDVLIIPELDIVRSVGNCAGMDILINFHKRLDGLFMSGHPGGALLKQKNARLSFCYSGCDVWNKNFVVSAFSLLKLEETDSPTMVTVTATPSTKMTKPTTTAVSPNTSPFTTTTTWKPLTNLQCNHSSLIGNPCQCREARCEFNIHTGRCSGRDPPCTSSITKWTGCRRPGAFYARAGVVCKNTVEEGECPSDDLILAVNIGGRELVSHSNIKYLADNPNLYKDPYGTRFAFDNNWDGYRCKQQFSNLLLIDKIHRSEWGLYSHMVQGKESLEEGCLSYPINVKRQGVYELTIKTAEEHHFSPKRSFTVLLNNQFVLYSFHILDYVPACTRMDIVIPFHVQNRLLTIFGFPEPSAIEGHSIDLSFCFTPTGCADHKLNYVVAAFHVLRVKGLTDITQLESHSTGSEGQQPLENYTYDGDEAAYFRECKKAGFEVDVANRRCVFGKRHCNPSVDWQECESQNSFYAHGGAICKGSSYKRGHCPQTVVTTAINFGGGRFKGRDDQRSGTGGGIAYHPEKNIVYNDPGGIRVVQDLKPSHCKKSPGGEVQVGGIMKENNGLYSTEVTAAPKTDGNKDNCLTYPLKVTGNGKYKVVVKMAELRHKGSGIRHFRLNLNKLVLAEELDITRYVSPCSGFNLISTFEILGDQLHLSGYNTPSAVLHNQVPLSFCYGSCDPSETCDPKFVGGSVHLIKFADLKLLTPPGTAPVYPVSTPRPQTKGPQSSNCNEVTDECDCRAKGCVFSSLIGKTTLDPTDDDQCQPSEVLCKGIYNGISCRRPGPEVVYSYGGLPCKSVFNSANCLVNKTIYGVNLFSGSFVDKRGIRYVKDNNFANGAIAGKLKNVSGTADSCARLHNTTPFPNVFLYRQIAYFGNHDDKTDPEEEDLCLSYQILIMENGLYELSIKMMDYRQHLQKQYFNIFFNGVLIQRSFRILDFVSYCEPLDVVIEFSVRFRKMSITGSQQLIPIPSNGIVELKFCNNDCRLDFALSLAAISVAKLKLDYHPAISGSGQGQGAPEGCLLVPDGPFKQCQCQAVRGCQFNYETGKCTHANYSKFNQTI